MEKKHLGKISHVKFGIGGYQDAMFGLTLHFEFDSGGTGDFKGTWDPATIECSEYAKWSESDRDKYLAEMCRFVSKIMHEAKVDDVYQLKGKPVEVTTQNFTMKSWRILTEVL